MSQENVDSIRRSFESYAATGEIEWDLIDPAVEVRDFDLPDAVGEVFRGYEGYKRWVSVWSAAWKDFGLAVFTLHDGRVTRCDYFGSKEGAFEAARIPDHQSRV